MAIHSWDWIADAESLLYPEIEIGCYDTYEADNLICATDGKTYRNSGRFECAWRKHLIKYGHELSYRHSGNCMIWETYGFETKTVVCVSKLGIDSIYKKRKKINLILCKFSLQITLILSVLLLVCVLYIRRAIRKMCKKDEPIPIVMKI